MSLAFEITSDDIMIVLERNGVKHSEERVNTIIDQLDFDRIEDAALSYDDMSEQTESAYEEIAIQLREIGEIA